jgi:hypothetical protein
MEDLKLSGDADVVAAWKEALALSRRLGFGLFKEAALSGAVLELCRHVVARGGKGTVAFQDASDTGALRARIIVDGCCPDLFGGRRKKLPFSAGPALPAVKLHQVIEALEAETTPSGARVTFTINQGRPNAPRRRPPSMS